MALSISAAAIIEKNKLVADGAWLVLLKIVIPNVETLYLVRNSDLITWNGQTWQPFPFELDDVSEDSKGELPNLSVRVANVTRTIQYYMEQGKGGVGSSVTLYVIHSKHTDIADPTIEEVFEVTDSKSNSTWATFSLGAGYPTLARRPERRIMKNFCPFKYGGCECGVSAATLSSYPSCNRTLASCRTRSPRNSDGSLRFGGEPTIPQGGLYV